MSRTSQKPRGETALPVPEFFWTPEQVAVMHQISKAAVFSAIERGEIVAHKPFENVVRIPDTAYRAWLARTTIKTGKEAAPV